MQQADRKSTSRSPSSDVGTSRRGLAVSLLGVLGTVALASACAPGSSENNDDSQPYDPELPPDQLTQSLQGSTDVRWFDTYAELRGVSGGASSSDLNIAIGRDQNIGGVFGWTADTTTADNGGTVIVPTASPRTGSWYRIYEGAVNPRWFGALGDGVSNDYAAFAAAVAILTSGGHLRVPPGDYVIGDSDTFSVIDLPSNVYVQGAGVATRFIRTGVTGAAFFRILGTSTARLENVRISNCKFEHRAYKNFLTAVQIGFADNVQVDNCFFTMDATSAASASVGDTLHAILSQRNSGVRAIDNRVEHLQFKMEGSTGGRKCIVQRNYFYQPHNYACSFVTAADANIVEAIICTHNIVENPLSGGGFHFGADGEEVAANVTQDITISDNIVFGSWAQSTTTANFGYGVKLGLIARNVRIERNTAYNEISTPAGNSMGIYIRRVADVDCQVDGLYVCDNTISGYRLEGIEVACGGTGVHVSGNVVSRSRGILVRAAGGDLASVFVERNRVDSTSVGVSVRADSGNLSLLYVDRNICLGIGTRALYVAASATYSITGEVTGNVAGVNGTTFGIQQEGAGTFDVIYRDNDTTGASSVGLRATNGTMTGRGNIGTGFTSHNKGRTSIPSGVSAVTVSHGLSGCAAAGITVEVVVMRPNGSAPVVSATCVDTITTTHFTANLSVATGSTGYELHWRVSGAEEV